MKKTDLLKIASAALATAAITVVTFGSGSLNAIDRDAQSPELKTQKLVLNGVEFTVKPAEGQNLKAGDKPVFVLAAVNTTDKPASADITLALNSTPTLSPFSRMVVMPSELSHRQVQVALKPGESNTTAIITDKALPTNQMVSVILRQTTAPINDQTQTANILTQAANSSVIVNYVTVDAQLGEMNWEGTARSMVVAMRFSTAPETKPTAAGLQASR